MTGLLRTDLPTPLKSELAASAFALQGCYGAVSGLAQDFGVSRPTVYAAAQTARHVLDEHFHKAQRPGFDHIVHVGDLQLQRAIVALRTVAPNSLRAIEALIPILYPGLSLSYGTIQACTAEAERRAARYNQQIDLSAISTAALDELFSQRQPVLAGVCLDSGYCFALSLQERRGGDEWADVLKQGCAQGLALSTVVKDAAKGIAAGVREVFPSAEQRDDCFHALYDVGKVARSLEKTAYGRIASEIKAEEDLERLKLTGKAKATRQSLVQKLVHAKRRAHRAIERYDTFEQARQEMSDALDWVDLESARIRTADAMEEALLAAGEKMIEIGTDQCQKVGRYVKNRAPGLALHMKALKADLDAIGEQYGERALCLGAVVYRVCEQLASGGEAHKRDERRRLITGAWAMLQAVAGSQAQEVLSAIASALVQRHRASSAIEGFHTGLRPFLHVHKGVSAGFLELFRATRNLRARRWGRHKGKSPHEVLTGEVVDDWLAHLGYPRPATLH